MRLQFLMLLLVLVLVSASIGEGDHSNGYYYKSESYHPVNESYMDSGNHIKEATEGHNTGFAPEMLSSAFEGAQYRSPKQFPWQYRNPYYVNRQYRSQHGQPKYDQYQFGSRKYQNQYNGYGQYGSQQYDYPQNRYLQHVYPQYGSSQYGSRYLQRIPDSYMPNYGRRRPKSSAPYPNHYTSRFLQNGAAYLVDAAKKQGVGIASLVLDYDKDGNQIVWQNKGEGFRPVRITFDKDGNKVVKPYLMDAAKKQGDYIESLVLHYDKDGNRIVWQNKGEGFRPAYLMDAAKKQGDGIGRVAPSGASNQGDFNSIYSSPSKYNEIYYRKPIYPNYYNTNNRNAMQGLYYRNEYVPPKNSQQNAIYPRSIRAVDYRSLINNKKVPLFSPLTRSARDESNFTDAISEFEISSQTNQQEQNLKSKSQANALHSSNSTFSIANGSKSENQASHPKNKMQVLAIKTSNATVIDDNVVILKNQQAKLPGYQSKINATIASNETVHTLNQTKSENFHEQFSSKELPENSIPTLNSTANVTYRMLLEDQPTWLSRNVLEVEANSSSHEIINQTTHENKPSSSEDKLNLSCTSMGTIQFCKNSTSKNTSGNIQNSSHLFPSNTSPKNESFVSVTTIDAINSSSLDKTKKEIKSSETKLGISRTLEDGSDASRKSMSENTEATPDNQDSHIPNNPSTVFQVPLNSDIDLVTGSTFVNIEMSPEKQGTLLRIRNSQEHAPYISNLIPTFPNTTELDGQHTEVPSFKSSPETNSTLNDARYNTINVAPQNIWISPENQTSQSLNIQSQKDIIDTSNYTVDAVNRTELEAQNRELPIYRSNLDITSSSNDSNGGAMQTSHDVDSVLHGIGLTRQYSEIMSNRSKLDSSDISSDTAAVSTVATFNNSKSTPEGKTDQNQKKSSSQDPIQASNGIINVVNVSGLDEQSANSENYTSKLDTSISKETIVDKATSEHKGLTPEEKISPFSNIESQDISINATEAERDNTLQKTKIIEKNEQTKLSNYILQKNVISTSNDTVHEVQDNTIYYNNQDSQLSTEMSQKKVIRTPSQVNSVSLSKNPSIMCANFSKVCSKSLLTTCFSRLLEEFETECLEIPYQVAYKAAEGSNPYTENAEPLLPSITKCFKKLITDCSQQSFECTAESIYRKIADGNNFLFCAR